MYMKDRKEFESDEAYLAYCWSLKPDDWSDEDWQEYLEWRQSLPGFDPSGMHIVFSPGVTAEQAEELRRELSKIPGVNVK